MKGCLVCHTERFISIRQPEQNLFTIRKTVNSGVEFLLLHLHRLHQQVRQRVNMSKDSATHISRFMGRLKLGTLSSPPADPHNGREFYDATLRSRYRSFAGTWFGYRYGQIVTSTSTSTSSTSTSTTTTITTTSTSTSTTLTTSTSTSTSTTL